MGRCWLILGALAIILVAYAPALSWADQPEADSGQHAKAAQEGSHEGGTNLFEKAIDLTIWTIVVFLILLFVLSRYAWKPMLGGLQKREHNIQSAQEEAKRDREEAQRLRDEVQKKLDGAAAEVQTMFEQGRRDAQKLSEDLMAKARSEIQAERDRLRREIGTARDAALHDIWNQSAQLATLISAKAIRRHLSPDDHSRLVDEALAELGQTRPA
jgi:F-type H+-transporting ATPase subunit b